MWCGRLNDRMSASLINRPLAQLVGKDITYGGGTGIILHPELATLLCSFQGDGGTMKQKANHGCSAREWCDPTLGARNDHQCPWRPADLEQMLKVHEARPFGYNELLISTEGWEPKLPELVEAFFWIPGRDGEASARAVHQGFRRKYPTASPRLFSLDLSQLDVPFAEPG